ncbi:MAG: hypothetical protein GWM92_06355 [Gemmatimonadetes bacterium]|nr:hypothetical protein [Gemmatimonadota bacterium]NIR78239.1 hypothetical protein [Gemmatimonadota bacterium]NIT86815.1 hypothetical protein [Gemmatimonadota bacterium]NIU30685.1 hypothetical protein [Gemmatimonadota bacterium]NIU35487.1 hypothetical protein [Gemmatimonadota bacterium]
MPTPLAGPNRGPARAAGTLALLVLALGLRPAAPAGAELAAQVQDSIPGVRLGLLYESSFRPSLAIKPFEGRFGGSGAAPRVEAIIARDLRYSDRFETLDSLPASVVGRPGVDYTLWDELGVVWLLTGQVEGAGEGFVLVLELHDVVYGEVRERSRIRIPRPEEDGFRMAVHRASDEVVRWVFDEPGMAASRIAFSRRFADGTQEVYTIDSDGENLRRLTRFEDLTLNPAWSPDGGRLAYISYRSGDPRLYERELTTGEDRVIEVGEGGQAITPAYHPSGEILAFSLVGGGRSGLYTYDVRNDCCLSLLTGGRWDDLSPTYSPDGRRLAFNSNRLGTAVPQIYVMPASGGEADLISPYVYGEGGYFTSPDWSPTGDRVAFHGRIDSGRYHILVADVAARGSRVLQLTAEGNNEDPSWAPDGRHLVFVGERNYGYGLFVVDAATGRIRTLLGGMRVRVPAWSPTLSVEDGSVTMGSDGG